jgi:hypothetical protein
MWMEGRQQVAALAWALARKGGCRHSAHSEVELSVSPLRHPFDITCAIRKLL